MGMTNFYRLQKTAKTKLWRNISGDHGAKFNLELRQETPIFKEEFQYFKNTGFQLSVMTSTSVRLVYNSLDYTDLPTGFIIIVKYKVSSQNYERFKKFVFNIPENTENKFLAELAKDFKGHEKKTRSSSLIQSHSYNFDYVLVVEREDLVNNETVYVPECNISISRNTFYEMPNNPSVAKRLNQTPVRDFSSETFKDSFKYSVSVQSIAPDHVPDQYFYFLGKDVMMTEAVCQEDLEEGIRIIIHDFDDSNKRINVRTTFIPIEKEVENGFFRTKGDLLSNGDPDKITEIETQKNNITLQRLKNEAELKKIELENLKANNEAMKLLVESSKNSNEILKNTQRKELLEAEKNHLLFKLGVERTKSDHDLSTGIATNQMKLDMLVLANELEKERMMQKFGFEEASLSLSYDNLVMKNELEKQASNRKLKEETFKNVSFLGSMLKNLF